jgi:serine/threonine protein kinase
MHDNRFLHRDIKPDNLYVYNGGYVLGDFIVIKDGVSKKTHNVITEVDIKVKSGQDLLDFDSGLSDVDPALTYIVINFGKSDMSYTEFTVTECEGAPDSPSATILVQVLNGIISAQLKAGMVAKSHLNADLQNEIDRKIAKKFNYVLNEPTVEPGNLAEFDANGDLIDSGKSLEDIEQMIEEIDLTDIEKAIEDLEDAVKDHEHTGADGTKKISYNNLTDRLTYQVSANINGTAADVALAMPSGAKAALIEYVATRAGDVEMGTLKYILSTMEMVQMDVIGEADVTFEASTNAGFITVENLEAGIVAIDFTITLI